jgi:hypothetical protein
MTRWSRAEKLYSQTSWVLASVLTLSGPLFLSDDMKEARDGERWSEWYCFVAYSAN